MTTSSAAARLLIVAILLAPAACSKGSPSVVDSGAGGNGGAGRDGGMGGNGGTGGTSGAGGSSGASGGNGGTGGTSGAGGSSGASGGNGGTGGTSGAGGSSGASGGNGGAGGASVTGISTTITLVETPEAFRNPMKGFRPSRYIQDGAFKDYEFTSTYKHYVPYSALENSAGDSVQKIKDWSDTNWGSLRGRNLKVIPRVTIVYPGTGEYWSDIPHDGTPNQWNTPELAARLTTFVAKLGQAWDDDPRVAAVEMGLWGKWGEHNISPDTVAGSDRIPQAFQQTLGDAFKAAFKNKKVMIRYPNTFNGYTSFGFYWDSFALPDDDNSGGGAGIVARDLWRTQMQSGEVAYDWGDQSKLGGSPNGTLSSTSNTDNVIGYIRSVHTSSLGWIAEYTPDNGTISANAARIQKELGYRFTIKQATFTSVVTASGKLEVSFTVANVGSAPFYYNWPVEVSLLDGARKVVWHATFGATDITQWLPGSTATVQGSFTSPVAGGTYVVAVAIADPASSNPSLRFANTNYYQGGRTPLGKVGIGVNPADQNLGPFDSLKGDNTLSY
jgi:hypothetical protein